MWLQHSLTELPPYGAMVLRMGCCEVTNRHMCNSGVHKDKNVVVLYVKVTPHCEANDYVCGVGSAVTDVDLSRVMADTNCRGTLSNLHFII